MQRSKKNYRSGVPTAEEKRQFLVPLGKIIRQARMGKGWSYRQMAQAIGKDAGTWCRVEHGRIRPRLVTLKLAATGLELDFYKLLKVVGSAVGVAKRK